MIGDLTGKIITKTPTQVLLDVQGVGYIINISINTFDRLSEENSKISLYTYLSVREDSLTLFGFYTSSEKELFEILIGVNGVGPKLALGILSGINVDEFKDAVANNNVSRLVSIPGIGKKTAERMIMELRDKINKVIVDTSSGLVTSTFAIKDDAIAALIGLGYNQKTAEVTTRALLEKNPSLSIEDLIKESLKKLNN
jgi:Holliday junction DNA helicase RuvA